MLEQQSTADISI